MTSQQPRSDGDRSQWSRRRRHPAAWLVLALTVAVGVRTQAAPACGHTFPAVTRIVARGEPDSRCRDCAPQSSNHYSVTDRETFPLTSRVWSPAQFKDDLYDPNEVAGVSRLSLRRADGRAIDLFFAQRILRSRCVRDCSLRGRSAYVFAPVDVEIAAGAHASTIQVLPAVGTEGHEVLTFEVDDLPIDFSGMFRFGNVIGGTIGRLQAHDIGRMYAAACRADR